MTTRRATRESAVANVILIRALKINVRSILDKIERLRVFKEGIDAPEKREKTYYSIPCVTDRGILGNFLSRKVYRGIGLSPVSLTGVFWGTSYLGISMHIQIVQNTPKSKIKVINPYLHEFYS